MSYREGFHLLAAERYKRVYCIYMSYREGFHRILSLPTPIEGARHRPQGIAVHLLENFPVYKMPFLSSLQIF